MPDVVVIEQTLTLLGVPIRHVSRLGENGSTIDLVMCYGTREREREREQDERFDSSRDVEGL